MRHEKKNGGSLDEGVAVSMGHYAITELTLGHGLRWGIRAGFGVTRATIRQGRTRDTQQQTKGKYQAHQLSHAYLLFLGYSIPSPASKDFIGDQFDPVKVIPGIVAVF